MIPNAFDYIRANSVEEAIQLLQEHSMDAKILAGGHSLLPAMKLRLSIPTKLIDIARISGLRYIKEDGDKILIGAATTHQDLVASKLIQEKVPLISQAGATIGDVQVRNVGTLGGSLAHADPAADWPASMLATEAEIVVKGPNGERVIPASDFFTGIFMTALEEDEILTEIRVPVTPADTRSTYVKFVQPASRFAIVGCAVMIKRSNGVCEDVKVAFTGVSESAFRDSAVEQALTGKAPDLATIEAATQQAAEGVSIMSDHFASEEYRKHLAKVYAKRALMEIAN